MYNYGLLEHLGYYGLWFAGYQVRLGRALMLYLRQGLDEVSSLVSCSPGGPSSRGHSGRSRGGDLGGLIPAVSLLLESVHLHSSLRVWDVGYFANDIFRGMRWYQ